MSIYHYPKSNVIDEVTFKKSAKGGIRAYLHAPSGTDIGLIDKTLEALKSKGYECIPFIFEGKPTLEVRGFKRENLLLALLGENKAISGTPDIITPPEEKISIKDKILARTLQASGLFYVAGDYNFVSYGLKGKNPLDTIAGLMYAGGTVSLVGYGRNDQSDMQVRDFAKKIIDHMVDEGIKIQDDHALHHLVENKPVPAWVKVDSVFRHYPSEMFNLFTGMAGACVATAAYKKLHVPHANMLAADIKRMKLEHMLDIGLGTLTLASTTYGGLVKEKAHDPDEPKKTGVAGVIQWARERPLVVTGAGLLVSTMCHAASTASAYQRLLKGEVTGDRAQELAAIKNRALFVLNSLAAELLITISSKGHGEGVVTDNSVDNTAIAITAELISKQPADSHEALIEEMGDFLGSQKMLALSNQSVKQQLREQVQTMCVNPWAMANGGSIEQAEKIRDDAKGLDTAYEPASLAPIPPAESSWQNKVVANRTLNADIPALQVLH